ncbi:MAG TPA: OpgC domain-containing protein, partial [Terriglobales bacterium]|nr:OpgC domain-containing protein [Terriglobales bacterium]
GYIFTLRAMKDGVSSMRHAFFRRALKLYGCHLALLFFLFTLITKIGMATNQPPVKNLVSYFLREPFTALWSSLLLIYKPPLLDILPMYVVFMLLSAWILTLGLRLGWMPILTASFTLWLLAQFGFEKTVYQTVGDGLGVTVPFHEAGAFDFLAWQFLWVLGLALGAKTANRSFAVRIPPPIIAGALVIGFAGFVWRHLAGQAPFGGSSANVLLDKWHLGPLRLINFLALLTLSVRFGPRLAHRLRLGFLEALGAASLPVFCTHLAVVLLALALKGDMKTPLVLDAAILAITFSLLYATARLFRPVQTKSSRPLMPLSKPPGVDCPRSA